MNYLVHEIAEYLKRFFYKLDDLFNRPNQREPFRQYRVGRLAEIKRKNIPAISEHPIQSRNPAMHYFLHDSPWDERELNRSKKQWAAKTAHCLLPIVHCPLP
ncbi:MAG: transposase, partial [Nitrososphaera sp.]|nr:transposase [Nitrososphaera sp.]